MNRNKRIQFRLGLSLLLAFGLWTVLVCTVDRQPIGPAGTSVGFAAMNGFVHRIIGFHRGLYDLTDILGLCTLGFVLGFAVLGLVQLIQRKGLCRVDRSILVLGGFYAVVLAAYLLFEAAALNYRPVLAEGKLEASYPSSTTLLALCILPTAMMQLKHRIQSPRLRTAVLLLLGTFTVLLVIGRLLSGVHWLSDIIGGMLLSGGLDLLYARFAENPSGK